MSIFKKNTESRVFNYPAVYREIIQQKHTLIAGACGSGKSVLIHGLIYTLLIPGDNLLACIDLKRVELGEYRRLKNCIGYADTAADAVQLLESLCRTMEKRYCKMQRKRQRMTEEPHIYLVIDEYAELTLSDKRINQYVQRLCQLGRAAGIHLILATQSPLAVVIPTQIKVNFDCVIALRTRSKRDSNYIIGCPGAELFPAFGQAFLYYPGLTQVRHIQVKMIPDADRERLLRLRK